MIPHKQTRTEILSVGCIGPLILILHNDGKLKILILFSCLLERFLNQTFEHDNVKNKDQYEKINFPTV